MPHIGRQSTRRIARFTDPFDAELCDTRTHSLLGIVVHMWGGWLWLRTDSDGHISAYRTNEQGKGIYRLTLGEWVLLPQFADVQLSEKRSPTVRRLDSLGIGPDRMATFPRKVSISVDNVA